MQGTRGKLVKCSIMLLGLIACVLRFYLLLSFTDHQTGFAEQGTAIKISIYLIVAVILAIISVYSHRLGALSRLVYFDDDVKSKHDYWMVIIVSASFFFDFVHQAFNIYSYVSKTSYFEHTWVILLAVCGILSLLCCFYFGTIALSIKDYHFDFSNFTFLHLVTVAWCSIRLLLIMQELIDFKLDMESILEFLTLTALTVFFFFFAHSVDKQGEQKRVFVAFSLVSFVMCSLLALPRAMVIIIGKGGQLSVVDYSLVTYLVLGVYSLTLSNKAIKN